MARGNLRTALKPVYRTHSGELCEFGDIRSAYLFARKGQQVLDSELQGDSNADEFFSGGAPKAAPVEVEAVKPSKKK